MSFSRLGCPLATHMERSSSQRISLEFKGEVYHIPTTLFTVTGMMPSRPELRREKLNRWGRERGMNRGNEEGMASETGGGPWVCPHGAQEDSLSGRGLQPSGLNASEAEGGEDRNVFSGPGSRKGASDLTKAISVEVGKWKPGWNGLESKRKVRKESQLV